MNGVPARVATGFAPGVREGRGRWRVRDLDAHSWVEVYFRGLGWVAFDPTPASAPAERPAEDDGEGDAAASAAGNERDAGGRGAPQDGAPDTAAEDPEAGSQGSRDGISPPVLGVGLLFLLGLAVAALRVGRFGWGRRSSPGSRSPEQEVVELRTALERLGYEVSPRTTLVALERTLATRAGPGAARYVRRLRQRRFTDAGEAGATPRLDRRALRGALAAGRGPMAHLRALLALPPDAVRPRR
jgi:hypothetical protein